MDSHASSLPLSVYIIARDEADRVGRTIAAALRLTDDVVVVEYGSTDDTAAVAAAAGTRVLHNEWTGFGAQKRFAEGACRHDWLLCLDADEVPSDALIGEIKALFAGGIPPLSFYNMKVVEVYPGKARPRLFAKQVNVVRLFDRRAGRTSLSAVHDRVEVPAGAAIGQLRHICLHYSIRSLAHLAEKYDAYTTLAAKTLKRKKRWLLAARLISEYPMAFCKYYLLHGHITGGRYGLQVAHIKAHARWRRIAKMWAMPLNPV